MRLVALFGGAPAVGNPPKVTAGRLALLVVGVALFAAVTSTTATTYFNSSEAGCDGSDPDVLMCDDFEDGVWYVGGCNAGGPGNPANDGWGGTVYADPITPPGAAVCGGVGAAGTNCTATHGVTSGSGNGRNMADHALSQGVSEIYVRFYTRPSSGYRFGDEKVLAFNQSAGACSAGIWFGNLALGRTGWMTWRVGTTGQHLRQNHGKALAMVGGRWYYVEIHIVLNTAGQNNGTLRLWINDCGTTGVCTGSPILRMSYTDVRFRHSSNSELIRNLWWENWAHPGVVGERYIDQIKVSKVGPIGFMVGGQ